jgi:uncharacterized protein YndB with AHSA1/START domain
VAAVHLEQIVEAPRERVWEAVSDSTLLPAYMPYVDDASPWSARAVGGSRRLRMFVALPVVETLTQWVDGRVLAYRAAGGVPLAGRLAVRGFEAVWVLGELDANARTRIDVRMTWASLPAAGLVGEIALRRGVAGGLRALARLVEDSLEDVGGAAQPAGSA